MGEIQKGIMHVSIDVETRIGPEWIGKAGVEGTEETSAAWDGKNHTTSFTQLLLPHLERDATFVE
jgi:hypothetical protein